MTDLTERQWRIIYAALIEADNEGHVEAWFREDPVTNAEFEEVVRLARVGAKLEEPN